MKTKKFSFWLMMAALAFSACSHENVVYVG